MLCSSRRKLAVLVAVSLLVIPVQALADAVLSPALHILEQSPLPSPATVTREIDGRVYIDLFLQGNASEADLAALGVRVNSRLPNGVLTAQVPLDNLQAVAALPGMARITAAHKANHCNDVSVPTTGATPNYWTIAPPNFSGQTGEGVIVGDVDTGIDWSSSDFKNPDGTTRILNIWDQTATGGSPPSGFTYGREWSQAQINSGLPAKDADGHGSHVMGSIAGNGSSTGNGQPAYQFIGMAPKADIIMVATDYANTHIVDGVNYIFQRAAALGKSAVVNLSLGSQYGAHDGTEDFDTAISALTGAGKIVVASAGNEGGESRHAEQVVAYPGSAQTVTFSIPTYTANAGLNNDFLMIDAYYPAAVNMRVSITSPRGTSNVSNVTRGNYSQKSNGSDGVVYVENGYTPSPSGDWNIYIQIWDGYSTSYVPRLGTWTITLTPLAGTGELDLWLAQYQLGALGVAPLFTSDVDEHELIGSPGSGLQVVTAGGWMTKYEWPSIDGGTYHWNGTTAADVGKILSYSSPGPLRNGVQKPDIAAPGSAIVSTKSSAVTEANPLINPDGVHVTNSGTSMSSAHVSGAVALILADSPSMTPAQAKAKLYADAATDANTGAVPNALWGYGKLRILRTDTQAPSVTVGSPNGGETWYRGSPHTITWTATDNVAVTTVNIDFSSDNGSNWTSVATGEANDGAYAWTVPAVTTSQALVRVTAFDAASNSGSDVSNGTFTTAPFIIVASAGPGGSIAPSGSVPVDYGGSQTFSITPDGGYDIQDVLVDGGSVGPVTSYPFTNVTANHTIAASFVSSGTNTVNAGTASDWISTAHTCVSVPIEIDRTNATPLRSFSVTIVLSSELALCAGTSSVTEGNYLSSVGTTAFQVTDNGGGSYTVDGAIQGTPCGVTASSGTLFTVGVTNAGGDGTGSVGISAASLADCGSAPVTASAGASSPVSIDVTPPAAVADLAASQVKSGNGSDGTTEVHLTFSPPGDATAIEVYRAGFGNYPEYDDAPNAGSEPAAPSYPPQAPWTLTGVTSSGQNDEVAQRDFWYYAVFSKDARGNVSSVSNKTAGTLNYYLSDAHNGLSPCTGDNAVNTSDLSFLGAHYGAVLSAPDTLACLDVGPTTDYSLNARPTTDNALDFEDLVVMGLSFGEFSKGNVRSSPSAADQVTAAVPASVEAGRTYAVPLLAEGTGRVHALSVSLTWDPDVVEPVAAVGGEMLARNDGVAFSPGPGRIDAAVLGAGVPGLSGGGVLATVTFRALKGGEPRITIDGLLARDGANKAVEVAHGESSAEPASIPRAVELLPAVPNPFNPVTTLTYRLPERANVELRIFAANGRLVRTMVSESAAAGEHSVVWNGKDDRGAPVPSGRYFVRLRAGGVTHTRTLTLLK